MGLSRRKHTSIKHHAHYLKPHPQNIYTYSCIWDGLTNLTFADRLTGGLLNPTLPMRAQEIRPFIIATGEEVKWSEGPQWLFLHVHTVAAGSGFHLPSPAHTAIILSAGTNPGLHLKNISAPCSVFWYGSMELFPGTVGSSQLTGGWKRCQTKDQNVVRKGHWVRNTVSWTLEKEYAVNRLGHTKAQR